MAQQAIRKTDVARRGRPFDLVPMDVQMPVMSGHEAAIELRRAWGPSALPIIALTAAARVSERALALAAGMNTISSPSRSTRRSCAEPWRGRYEGRRGRSGSK